MIKGVGLLLIFSVAIFIPPAEAAAAEAGKGKEADWHQLSDTVTVGGSVRVRLEDKNDFQFDPARNGNDDNFLLSQVRFHLAWQASRSLSAFFEFQDARVAGEEFINQDARPNIFVDELDIFYQGYLSWKFGESGNYPAELIVGRQKINLGIQRLVSSLEWVNTARIVDGFRLRLGSDEKRILDIFGTKLVPIDPDGFNDHNDTGNRLFDSEFGGIYFTDKDSVPNSRYELYGLYRRQDDFDDRVITLGGRIAFARGRYDFDAEIARQTGDFGGLDQDAEMAHFAFGYTVPAWKNSRFGIAYNYGSGDDDPTDGDHETFDNLYPLNHAFYGYMDFFALQNLTNLELNYKVGVGRNGTLKVAYHDFHLVEEDTDAWYNAGAGVFRAAPLTNVDSEAGQEVDVTYKFSLLDGRLGLLAGYSHFDPGDRITDTGSPGESANYFFLQGKINF